MFKGKNVLVVIPARSGSTGIKDKNIQKLNGKPLLAHSIIYALKSKIVDKIIVSTDSKKYAKIAKKFKAEIPFIREKKLAGNLVPDFPVIYDSLKRCERKYLKKFDFVILLRPTSPLREKGLIEKSLILLTKGKKCTSVRAVKQTPAHPYRNWLLKKNGFIKGYERKIKEPYNLERQKLPKVYFQTGDIETIKRSTLINGSISGENVRPLVIKNEIIDIDKIEDFKLAKSKSER